MSRDNTWTWVILGGAAAAFAYYLQSRPQATPLSIYPSLAWTAATSMAATPAQKAVAAIPPTGQFTSVQQQEQGAVLAQCVGSYPLCTPLASDTQLGL